MPSGFFPLKILFKINLQAAIVAGIESGWVNPVINKEYAMEEVVDHYHIVTNPSENQHFAAQIFSDLNTLQAQQVHYDIIHSKGAKGKLVLRVAADE